MEVALAGVGGHMPIGLVINRTLELRAHFVGDLRFMLSTETKRIVFSRFVVSLFHAVSCAVRSRFKSSHGALFANIRQFHQLNRLSTAAKVLDGC